ncbi:ribosomal RNA small subunit methyltransferase E [Microlunatus endophyticus]|uniref:Ribosomal RNA small subunit methyltransferase E n=1 Tax=Microlunatus endophyticus TaxID=1716077 RepID=A0A917W326_9ACTN|nr:16S rRNA (uracil(1498)-N(3))-methyltransferase [Microlunatus endophyticus]GGL62876.1 ribosomal RNA small subunit methyltransferase E [Microlunatus endophyticus]
MTDPVFLGDLPDPLPAAGTTVVLDGPEGRHAATVRRIRPGERVIIADGTGRGIAGPVTEADKSSVTVEVQQTMFTPEPELRITVAQALAKGDRSDIALEMITELGATKIIPWQSARSIVRWSGDRADKSLARWQATVREATKQSRRLRIPVVDHVASTKQLAAAIDDHDLTLILHEEATIRLPELELPTAGRIMIIVGPEGGIAPEELELLVATGGRPALISDGVLRTSTAAAVAMAAILLR